MNAGYGEPLQSNTGGLEIPGSSMYSNSTCPLTCIAETKDNARVRQAQHDVNERSRAGYTVCLCTSREERSKVARYALR